jgi:hypothetical protein
MHTVLRRSAIEPETDQPRRGAAVAPSHAEEPLQDPLARGDVLQDPLAPAGDPANDPSFGGGPRHAQAADAPAQNRRETEQREEQAEGPARAEEGARDGRSGRQGSSSPNGGPAEGPPPEEGGEGGMSCGGEERGGQCHVVAAGETLAGIAEATYDDASRWADIVAANPETVHPGSLIVVGEILNLPLLCVEPATGECTEPDSTALAAALSRAEYFEILVAQENIPGALDLVPWFTDEDRAALAANTTVLAAVGATFPFADAVLVLDVLAAPTLQILVNNRNPGLDAAFTSRDPLIADLLARTPDGAALMRPLAADTAAYARFLVAYQVAPHEQLLLAGFDLTAETCSDSPIDADLLVRVLSNLSDAERRDVLLGLRRVGAWGQLLTGLGARHVALVRGWIGEDAGDGTGQSLDERINAAENSDRARDARARVEAVAAQDPHTPARITPRLLELLVLGVALPSIEGEDLSTEGVLGAVQAERAAQALMRMPDQEYIRTVMLLESTGDSARLTQSFLLLKALAARADRFTDTDTSNDQARELEDFSDRIRPLDAEEAVTRTSTTQRTSFDTGAEQTFTMSCGPTAGIIIGAEADPIRGLELDDAGYSVTDSGGDLTATSETALENHRGNTAILRPEARTELTDDINRAIAGLREPTPAADLDAVRGYIGNANFDERAFARGVTAIRDWLARRENSSGHAPGYPNDQELRRLRATVGDGNEYGLDATEIATEFNNDETVNADARTGATYTVNAPATLSEWLDALPGGVFPAVVPEPIATQVDALLATAAGHVEDGYDVGFAVRWSGGGGHMMTFTHVGGSGAGRSFLVANSSGGTTTWVTQADLRQARLGDVTTKRGLVVALVEPTPPAAPRPPARP